MINDYRVGEEGVNGGQAIASASGALVSIEQITSLRSSADGSIISIEQITKSKASGAVITIQQVVL